MPDRKFRKGDVVYAEGASALLGDVIAVVDGQNGDQFVTVRWRETDTTEDSADLVLEQAKEEGR